MQSLLERAIPCRHFIEHVLGTITSSCWGAPYGSVWRGREHRGVRMLRGTVIAGIFFLAVAMLAFFLMTAMSWHLCLPASMSRGVWEGRARTPTC
jgi:hypothetical protein